MRNLSLPFLGLLVIDGLLTQLGAGAELAKSFWDGKAWSGRTQANKANLIAMRLGANRDADPEQWRAVAKAMLAPARCQAAKADELERWSQFWSRNEFQVFSR